MSKYLVHRRNPPSQTWRTFLENHVKTTVSIDFFTVPTIRFQVSYVFLVLAHERRRIVHFNVTAHPTAECTGQQLREAFPFEQIPRYLLFQICFCVRRLRLSPKSSLQRHPAIAIGNRSPATPGAWLPRNSVGSEAWGMICHIIRLTGPDVPGSSHTLAAVSPVVRKTLQADLRLHQWRWQLTHVTTMTYRFRDRN